MSNSEYREAQQQARTAGLAKRQEVRGIRAQTVIGELEQQVRVHAEGAYVRLVVADETGESFHTIRLTPEATERLTRILTQAKAIVEASA